MPHVPFSYSLGKIDRIYYANSREDAAEIDFDDDHIYNEVSKAVEDRIIPMKRMMHEEAKEVFKEWKEKEDKIHY